MLSETNLLLCLAASLPLIMTPGPDIIYVAARFALLCLFVYGVVGFFSGSLGDVLVEKQRFAGALR